MDASSSSRQQSSSTAAGDARVCNITEALVRRQASVGPHVALGVIASLDLHLRDSRLGKVPPLTAPLVLNQPSFLVLPGPLAPHLPHFHLIPDVDPHY